MALSYLQEIEQQFDQLFQAGEYRQALELVTRTAHLFPDYSQKIVYSWRFTTAARLGDAALTLSLLQEAIQTGHWYAGLQDDPDLALLRGRPEFDQLVATCAERRLQAIAEAKPTMQILHPEKGEPPYPLLLALHGAHSNLADFASHWIAAAHHGWLVGLPQSGQAFGQGTFSWNDWDWARQEILKHFETLCRDNPVDRQRIILAGFSQGGGVAAWLALKKRIPVHGLLLVGPFLPEVESILPWLEEYQPYELRAHLVGGERDQFCLGIARQMAEILPRYGIPAKLEVYPDLEYSFPLDFEKRLPQALDELM